jgi:hypothetical protein
VTDTPWVAGGVAFDWDLSQRKIVFFKPVAARPCIRPNSQEWTFAEENGSIWSYDLELGREVWSCQIPREVRGISYDSSGGRLAIARLQNPKVLVVRVATGEVEKCWDFSAGIRSVAWSPDGDWMACPATDGRIYLRDLTSDRPGVVLEEHIGVVTAAAFNPGGDLLVTTGWDGTT